MVEYRRHVKNHNCRIKEHDMFYLDTKNEISLTMFIYFFLISPSTWRPWGFLPWSPSLHLKLHGAPLVMWHPSLHVDFSLFVFSFLPACMAPLSSCWLFFIIYFLPLFLSCFFLFPFLLSPHGCLKWLFIDFFSKMSHFISPKSWKLVANNQIYQFIKVSTHSKTLSQFCWKFIHLKAV